MSRNYDRQLPVCAGLTYVRGKKEAMIIDGDLQDPPELVNDFNNLLENGYDVINAVRKNRKERFYKKQAYSSYYHLQKKISNFDIPIDSGYFSMLSRRVVDNINNMPEQSQYLRRMRAWLVSSNLLLSMTGTNVKQEKLNTTSQNFLTWRLMGFSILVIFRLK